MRWKKIESQADMPTRTGEYVVIDRRDPIPSIGFISREDKWDENIIAYIPEPIPDFEDRSLTRISRLTP